MEREKDSYGLKNLTEALVSLNEQIESVDMEAAANYLLAAMEQEQDISGIEQLTNTLKSLHEQIDIATLTRTRFDGGHGPGRICLFAVQAG